MKFGDIVVTTDLQDKERGIKHVPVGTKCVVIEIVDLPGYDLLVVPEGYIDKIVDSNGCTQNWHTIYLLRGSWKLI